MKSRMFFGSSTPVIVQRYGRRRRRGQSKGNEMVARATRPGDASSHGARPRHAGRTCALAVRPQGARPHRTVPPLPPVQEPSRAPPRLRRLASRHLARSLAQTRPIRLHSRRLASRDLARLRHESTRVRRSFRFQILPAQLVTMGGATDAPPIYPPPGISGARGGTRTPDPETRPQSRTRSLARTNTTRAHKPCCARQE
jgi:hypothetical protein